MERNSHLAIDARSIAIQDNPDTRPDFPWTEVQLPHEFDTRAGKLRFVRG